MYATQNMCSAHIFKVAYMYLLALICDSLTLLTPQLNALRRSALMLGKVPFYRREHTTAYVTKKKGALTTQEGAYTQCPRLKSTTIRKAADHKDQPPSYMIRGKIMSLLCQSVIAHLSASRFDTNNISLSNGNVNAFFKLFYKDCVKFFIY